MNEATFDPSVLQQGLVDAAVFVRDVWRSAVSGSVLPGMHRAVNDDKYAAALNTGDSIRLPAAFQAIVLPVGYADGVNRVEEGYPAYDMKPGLLNGPKSRPLKDGSGRYNTVPFRHYTPASPGGGSTAISIKMRMPDEVYRQAKNLGRSLPGASGKIDWNQSLSWDAAPATNFMGYTHTASIYQGMYRVGDPGHTQYLTFRRVSTPRTVNGKQRGSDPRAWWHPGAPGNPVAQAVYDYCMPQVEQNLIALAEKMAG
jgi:hypothetical protein